MFEDLSKEIVVSQGGPSSSNQSSGSNARSQNQIQPTSPRGGTTPINMAGVDNTLRLPEFQGIGSGDLKKTLVCLRDNLGLKECI